MKKTHTCSAIILKLAMSLTFAHAVAYGHTSSDDDGIKEADASAEPAAAESRGADEPAADSPTTESFPSVRSRWPSPEISVCWEASADGFATAKQWLRTKVQAEFETKTPIRFYGWNRCTADSAGIRISVSDLPGDNPHTKGLGYALDGVRNGMELNFTFRNWSSTCRYQVRKCIESIGVHEFGHAIGLAHEHNRPDTPSTCRSSRQGGAGDMLIGRWDINSVMNYCNPVYNNNGNLTSGDVAGIYRLYGRR